MFKFYRQVENMYRVVIPVNIRKIFNITKDTHVSVDYDRLSGEIRLRVIDEEDVPRFRPKEKIN